MLSVVLTAWNEAEKLPMVLTSVKDVADEIVVVVDEATDDQSAKIARAHGCRVFTHPHTGYVEPMRNFSIGKASGEWILLLDGDEVVPGSLALKIKELINDASVSYYRIPRKNIIFGKWVKSHHWWPDYSYRLFKKGTVTWGDEIHSVPVAIGKGQDLPATEEFSLIHYNYSSVDEYLEQISRYTQFQAAHRFAWSDLICKPADEFINQYFARGGYKEGVHGLALALLQASSELILYLRAWERTKFKQQDISTDEVASVVFEKVNDFRWWKWPGYLRPVVRIIRRLGL